jgi:hypothetical protein
MPIYFMLFDAGFYSKEIQPALAESWARRSFDPCRRLSTLLTDAAHRFSEIYHTGPEEPLLLQVARDIPFDRRFWQLLAGEVLLFAATEIPEFPVCPETLGRLLAPGSPAREDLPRQEWPPIYQAHYGSRYLQFGARAYRPEQAGFSNVDDVARLADYLANLDPAQWSAAHLSPFIEDNEARQEELEDARDWFPALCDLYTGARTGGNVMVCEVL